MAPLDALRRSLFFISVPMVFISFALPLRAQDIGASAFQIGLMFSLFTASLFIFRPLVGIGLDRFGRRPFFLLALFIYLCINGVYAWTETVESFFIARVLHGIGFAFLSITTDTITADLTKPDGRAAAMGGNIGSQRRGGMVGAFIGFTLVGVMPLHAWVYSFTTFAVISMVALLFAFRAIPETKPKTEATFEALKFDFQPKLRRLLVVIVMVAFSGALTMPYLFIYLRDRFDLELAMLAFAFIPLGLAHAVLPAWLGRKTNTLSRATATSLGLAIGGCLYLFVPHVPTIYGVVALITGAATGILLAELTKNAWIADITHESSTGRAYGTAAFAAGIGSTVAPLVGGVIYDQLGSAYLFYANALILLTATVVVLFFVERDQRTTL